MIVDVACLSLWTSYRLNANSLGLFIDFFPCFHFHNNFTICYFNYIIVALDIQYIDDDNK